MNTEIENTTGHNLEISDETYERLDRYRLRRTEDIDDPRVWTESWDEFFQRHFDSNVFIELADIRDPEEIDVGEIGMLEE